MSLTEKFKKAQAMTNIALLNTLQDSPELATASDDNGCTLLFHACAQKDLGRIVVLISEGANPNQGNKFGVQPIEAFMNAATKGVQRADNHNDLILRSLVESGAYPTDKAIMKAQSSGYDEWADYMTAKSSCMQHQPKR